jgi:hypothetical protein
MAELPNATLSGRRASSASADPLEREVMGH